MSADEYDMLKTSERNRFVADSWLTLACFAYQIYLTDGRGAVWMREQPDGSVETQYAVLKDYSDDGDELAECIKGYNPDREIVMAFDVGEALAIGIYEAKPYPPEAFALVAKEQGGWPSAPVHRYIWYASQF